ncbi:hypothetical protein PW5551_10350 [Petrotoga sp. 9PW.55.5.1]|uniref:GIY-YIG nuclease family protein n=1 Tax=Petrotoga sp. 9PW.55.5.1 TaxID=1308979 RepID=UPI000DC3173E|nr:GIY-YIG nuclease family protein [Petrotoga sp. 9PW.55.5.1]RAO98352.1 hypothetical protein PW5551_10350 [Petrotoga sp. 9PW.55.5.1]
MNKWYVYIILCDDGSLYKGHTNNLERGYNEHCLGRGANHTKLYKPVKIVYSEQVPSLEDAVAREKYFKTGSGREWIKNKLKEMSE